MAKFSKIKTLLRIIVYHSIMLTTEFYFKVVHVNTSNSI